MFLLPLFTGFLLVFQGHGYSAYGPRNTAARELEDNNDYLDELFDRYRQILDVQHKRLQQQKQELEVPSPDWIDDTGNDDNVVQKEVSNDGINFAATDGDDDPSNNAANQEENTKPETSTNTVTDTAAPPLKHEKLVAKPSNEIHVIKNRDFVFLMIITGCSVAGLVGLIMAGVCWYKLHKRVKAASDVDYPAYGVTGPTKERLPSPGDRKLAQSAQMYHYQHQKQQMIAMEKANGEMKQDGSEDESEEENEEGDYTVYECPGLAPTGEMEVRNPLFTEETQTPVNGQQQPVTNGLPDDKEQE